MRRKQFEIESIGKPSQFTICQLVQPHRNRTQRLVTRLSEPLFLSDEFKHQRSFPALLKVLWIHYPIGAILPQDDRGAHHITMVVVKTGEYQSLDVMVFQ